MVLRSFQSFGRVDAESDLGLADFFLETPAYRDIEERRRLVVTGRKGTGKTAIYATLLHRAQHRWDNVFATGLDLTDYPWDLQDRAATTSESPTAERHAVLWEFLILVQLARLASDSVASRGTSAASQARRKLQRFVKRNWGSDKPHVGQTFARANYKLTVEPKFLGFSLGALQRERVARSDLASRLPRVNDWLRTQLQLVLRSDAQYFVLFDDLDSGFRTANDVAQQRLIGLLNGARDLRVWAEGSGIPFTPVIFLRSDIYAALKFSNKNKISTELVERITWSAQQDTNASLRRLLVARMGASLGIQSSDPWSELFEGDAAAPHSLYEDMVARTQLRPRDMIRLANACLTEAKAAGAPRIGAQHLAAAEPAYSRYLLDEIADEAHQSTEHWDTCIMVLQRIGTERFSRSRLAKALGDSLGAAISQRPEDYVLRMLYAHGAIGHVRRDSVIYGYRSEEPLDLNAERFAIHPGLLKALGVTPHP